MSQVRSYVTEERHECLVDRTGFKEAAVRIAGYQRAFRVFSRRFIGKAVPK